ncbi:MAG: glycogen synthase [Candidatus Abyssobacteria bacterium SURF_5]|uniref:Glycogen synthase n=1 Tax=Abyssobacteria bacterium (strain SURF_5) TaxID=2093360 RepID=A0A3A4NY72_ABYX5|nr:MAG: glycogen synthase [Candidatus Abyssubacteria bacterium SURF_5]
MRVLFAASEAVPFVKTGGLADVIGSLPQALHRSGKADISVVLPKYNCINTELHDIVPTGLGAEVPINGVVEWANVWECKREIHYFFIDNPRFYDRPHPYQENGSDYSDNAERFIFFSRAVLELCHRFDVRPDIIHCHDWHTALIPVFLRTKTFFFAGKRPVASAFTVHNAGYQGKFPPEKFKQTGLPSRLFNSQAGLRHGDGINLLKGGLLFSDVITTVSPRYCEELKSWPGGNGLEDVFRRRSDSMVGILNGIDLNEWNPASDPFLVRNYDVNNPEGKRECKRALQKRLALPDRDDIPLLAAVMRLTEQKGTHLVEAISGYLGAADVQFVILGSGNPAQEETFRRLSRDYAHKCCAVIGDTYCFDQALVHQVEAGADIFLMPSLYEPCGLSQMFSLRYGTVPVVRMIGGLDDTVKEYDPATGSGNGFTFFDPVPEQFLHAVDRAISCFSGQKTHWRRIMKNGMSADFSWDTAAAHYLELYERALRLKDRGVIVAGKNSETSRYRL